MKLFCLGLHKTGTTSFRIAMENEGFRVARYFGIEDPNIGETALHRAIEMIPEYDAFQDDPWYLFYREFHERAPDAKFVLLTRNSHKWIKSCLKHFGGQTNEVRKIIYGPDRSDPMGNENHWIACKEKHEAKVRNYFAKYPEIFLEMDVTKGDGWDKLWPFISHKPKVQSFPKVNTALGRKHQELEGKCMDARGLNRFRLRVQMRLVREMDKRR